MNPSTRTGRSARYWPSRSSTHGGRISKRDDALVARGAPPGITAREDSMLRSQWAASAALVLLAGIPASGAIGQTETPFLSQTESKQPPGEGALCLLAIYSF